ncbi:MAG TPA: hypothetical protein VLZ31_06560 [Microbacteriaceae bacterium]|nr:hypothetical protein [Microbacteriaceae bacterium]
MGKATKQLMKSLIFGSIGGVAIATFGIARHFASRVVTPLQSPNEPLEVLDFMQDVSDAETEHKSTITLSRGEDSDLPGNFSLIFDGGSGHAQIGEVVLQNETTVTRRLIKIISGDLRPGVKARLTGWWYDKPEDLAGQVKHVNVDSELGPMPAWLISPSQSSQKHVVIHVHGRGARKEETLRGVAPISELGVDSLIIGYRNDADCPKSLDGKYGLGFDESRDVIAAVKYAKSLGFSEFTLFGWSMGATASLQALRYLNRNEPNLALSVKSLILESPAVDWPEVLKHHADIARVPRFIADIAAWIISKTPILVGLRTAIPLKNLTSESFADDLSTPTLIIVSEQDTFVPFEGALNLAHTRQDLVRLFRAPSGEHVKIWNENEETWNQEVSDFMVRNSHIKNL